MILSIPMKLPSAGNLREHWRTRAKRNKAQRQTIALHMRLERLSLLALQGAVVRGEQLRVTLVRIAPRSLDDDNLAFAFKACRDEVAKQLGVNDGSDSVLWCCQQLKPPPGGKPGVMLIAMPVASAWPSTIDELTSSKPTAPGRPQRRLAVAKRPFGGVSK